MIDLRAEILVEFLLLLEFFFLGLNFCKTEYGQLF